MTTRTCPGHGEQGAHTLPLESFGSNVSRADGIAAYCKKCNAAIQKDWRKAHPEKVLAAKRKAREREKAGA